MCEFCAVDPKEREQARKNAEQFALRLESMAESLRAIVHGRIKPHTDAMKTVEYKAKAILRTIIDYI